MENLPASDHPRLRQLETEVRAELLLAEARNPETEDDRAGSGQVPDRMPGATKSRSALCSALCSARWRRWRDRRRHGED